MSNLRQVIAELEREQSMRIRVWPKIKNGGQILFKSRKHNEQYQIIVELLSVLKTLNERNWVALQNRATGIITANSVKQGSLFNQNKNLQP